MIRCLSCLLLAVCFLIMLSCGTVAESDDILLKHDYLLFSIGFQGLIVDEIYGNTLRFSFTNQSDEPLMVSIDSVKLDTVFIQTFFADLVEPGETHTQQVVIESAAQYMNDWILTEVSADLWVYKADNLYDSDIFHDEVIFLPQGSDNRKAWVRAEKPSDIPVFDDYFATVTMINADHSSDKQLVFSLHSIGKTDRQLLIRADKIWINGTPLSIYYASKLNGICQSFSTLEIQDGLDYLINVPGQNTIKITFELAVRDGQKLKTLKRENVSFKM
ncbi:MAG: hypothetical protein IJ242_16670 [Clostridia bacterium]|nr:hypothetical protein [Clostridia bacterium]